MYRKYVLDRVEEQPPQDASTFPDTHLIVGEAQSKAARAGAAHRRDSGVRVPESGTYRSDRSDSGIESELGGSHSKRSSVQGTESELGASFTKVTAVQSKGDYRVELKSHREWAPYKKPYRVKSEPDIVITKPVKQKSDSGVQCDLAASGQESRVRHNDPDVVDGRSSTHSESEVSRISSFSDGYLVSQVDVRPPRHSRHKFADVDLFDDFVSRDHTPEFRRPPREITVTDTDGGVSQRVGFPPKTERGDKRASPLRLWDAHGCHNVRQEVIVARPIADAAKAKPRSPLSFQNPRSDGFARMLVETAHPLHSHAGHSYGHSKDIIKVLPAQEGGLGTRSNMVSRHDVVVDSRDPKKLSPRYSKHLQGENPWAQAAQKVRQSEKPQQVFESSSGNPGTSVPSGASGFYTSLCCNKGSVSKR